ncbi:hypothetical protein PsYK624_062960 [Phanerochaete sordida]|uniref:Uncharacterized protein n=1 Tax=Phanerochaete sordida TaxID=48140 RepID=A0A9P3G928_9APHY|nr:hypothetical protein PsYK624_062960 [Phanerochaete sordida]
MGGCRAPVRATAFGPAIADACPFRRDRLFAARIDAPGAFSSLQRPAGILHRVHHVRPVRALLALSDRQRRDRDGARDEVKLRQLTVFASGVIGA